MKWINVARYRCKQIDICKRQIPGYAGTLADHQILISEAGKLCDRFMECRGEDGHELSTSLHLQKLDIGIASAWNARPDHDLFL